MSATPLFKFCSADSAKGILENNCVFVTSPLDLNDPFEMRPAWTADHEHRRYLNEQKRDKLMALAPHETQMPMDVKSQRGIADGLLGPAFEILHERFRVLSLVGGLFALAGNDGESDEQSTLMWSHYADQFQGVCLALDSASFENGIQKGGYDVQYDSPDRRSLPPSFYDTYLSLGSSDNLAGFDFDPEADLSVPKTHKEEMLRKSFIDLLTFKSPVWRYEQEVRMLYEHFDKLKSPSYRRRVFACATCRQHGQPPEKCKQTSYRDAVYLPPKAILAVVFGADCPSEDVERLLTILATDPFKSVKLYWSALHSERYALHYIRADAKDIRSFYEGRDELVAQAKGHFVQDRDQTIRLPSKKTVTYDMSRRGDSPPEQS